MPKDKVKGMATVVAARKRKMKQGISFGAAVVGFEETEPKRGCLEVGSPSEEGKGPVPSTDVPNVTGTGTPTSDVPIQTVFLT